MMNAAKEMTKKDLDLAISKCETMGEFEDLVNGQPHLFDYDWGAHFRSLERKGLLGKPADIAKACDIGESTVRGFRTRIPAKRLDVIKLAMMMGMTVAEANDLLVNYAKYHRLYAKNPEDVIAIYLLVAGCKEEPAKMFAAYKAQYEKLHTEYRMQTHTASANNPREDTNVVHRQVVNQALRATLNPENDEIFNALMKRLIPGFSQSHEKLRKYIEDHFTDLETEELDNLNNRDLLDNRNHYRRFSPNECFANDRTYRDLFYRAMRESDTLHKAPSRLFLVSLGVRLHMPIEHINHMLDLAGMGPLCPNDRLEAALVYILDEVSIQNPTIFYWPTGLDGGQDVQDLQEFSMKDELDRLQRKKLAEAEFRKQKGLPEPEEDPDAADTEIWSGLEGLENLNDKDLTEYLKWKLEDMRIFQGSSRRLRDKLIDLL